MESIMIKSLNVGTISSLLFKSKQVNSAIYKKPIDERVFVTKTHIEGDEQADKVHHGGLNQAVCVYPFEHFSEWQHRYGLSFQPGAFGENITLTGATETDIWIGDVFQVGTAILQVSQPRQPCYKVAARYQLDQFPTDMESTGYTGFYFRVLEEGTIRAGQQLKRVSRGEKGISISLVNRIKYIEKDNLSAISSIVEEPALSEGWRTTFLKRLK